MRTHLPALTLASVVAVSGVSSAAWNSLSDFEFLSPGPLGSQGGWTSELSTTSEYTVTSDPDNPSNQVLLATGTSAAQGAPNEGNAYIPLGVDSIAEGTTGTVFFRMRTSDLSDIVFGASDVAAPFTWSSYEGYMVMGSVAGENAFRVRDGGAFSGNLLTYSADQWYNIWLVLDHAADTVSLYTSQGSDAAALLGSGGFRTGNEPDSDLVSLNLRMGSPHLNNSAQGYLDDIFVDSTGENLAIPSGIGMPALPGDVNLDGLVDAVDYALIRDNFRTQVADPTLGDLTGPSGVRDGFVDFYDFGEWKDNASAATLRQVFGAAPEPTSLVLAACLALGAPTRRR
ncbi:MAG: hypothetical protein AAGJ46_01745 [Planctomycetota bacterium]